MAADDNDKETLEKRAANDADDDCETGVKNSTHTNNEVIAIDKDDDDDSVSVDKDILTPLEVTAPEDNYVRGTCTDHENRDLQSLIEFKYDRVRYNKDSVSKRKQYKLKDGIALQIYQGELLLPETSFSFIVASDPWGDTRITFYIAWIVWILQITLLSLLTYDNYKTTSESYGKSNPFGFSTKPDIAVTVSQYISVFLMVVTSSEIPGAVSQILRGYDTRKKMFHDAFPNTSNKKQKWHIHNLLRVLEGLFALVSAFITIMQQDTVRTVLLSFGTLQVITRLDDIAYSLCLQGFIGRSARRGAINVILAKYNYDAYKLPSETKFCGYGSHTVDYLDGKLRFLIMTLLVAVSWTGTSVIVHKQRTNTFNCSEKIINDELYKKVERYCSGWVSSLDGERKEKLTSGGDTSLSDVPFVVAVKGKTNAPISWKVTDLDREDIKSAYGKSSLVDGTGKFVDGVYVYYTCIPRSISGVWVIEKSVSDYFFDSRSGIYKIKSEVPIDGKKEEACMNYDNFYEEDGGVKQSHLIGHLFSNCTYDIETIGNGKCDTKYNTTECAFDGGDCLVEQKKLGQSNNASTQVDESSLADYDISDEEESIKVYNDTSTSLDAESDALSQITQANITEILTNVSSAIETVKETTLP